MFSFTKSEHDSLLPVGWRAGKGGFIPYLNLHFSWQCLSCKLAALNYFAATAPYVSLQQLKIAVQSEETSTQGVFPREKFQELYSPFVLLGKCKETG